MKKKAEKSTALLLLTSSLSSTPLYSCGSVKEWLDTFVAHHQNQVEYVDVKGEALFNAVVQSVIQSLKQLCVEDQTVFIQFVNRCLNVIVADLPVDTITLLNKFNLVQSDGTISPTIQNIVSMSVERLDDGSVDVWSFVDLLNEGWITAVKGQA